MKAAYFVERYAGRGRSNPVVMFAGMATGLSTAALNVGARYRCTYVYAFVLRFLQYLSNFEDLNMLKIARMSMELRNRMRNLA